MNRILYRPETVGFLYTEARKGVEVLCKNTSKKQVDGWIPFPW